MHEFFPLFVTQVWQVTLLAVVVWIVTKTFCKRRPHLGHALWLLVLVKCVVPPVFSSSTSVYSWLLTDEKASVIENRIVDTERPTAVASSQISVSKPIKPAATVPIVTSTQVKPTQTASSVSKPAPKVAVTREPPTSIYQRVVSTSQTPTRTFQPQKVSAATALVYKPPVASQQINGWHSWFVKIWLGVAALFLAVTTLRYVRFRSWIRRQASLESSNVQSQTQTLAKQLKLRRKIRVNVVDAEFGPAVIGLLRPTIVLPHSIVADKTTEQLEPILGHELLHLRRGDIYWSVLQVVACSLMWFHPLVWLASRNVTRESEKCCDEETIANFQCDRANYARVLVDILEQKSRLRIAPVVPGVRPADITSSRLERIMQSDNGTCRRTPRWIWALAFLIAIGVIPGAAMVQSQESDVARNPTVSNGGFQSDIARWQLAGAGSQEPSTRKDSESVFAEDYRKEVKQRLQRGTTVAPLTPQAQRANKSFGDSPFNPGAAKAQFEAKVLAMVKGDEQQRKILAELKDKAWQSNTARVRLQNCKNRQVALEVRVAKVPKSLIEESALGGQDLSELQIPQDKTKALLDLIAATDGAEVSPANTHSFYPSNNIHGSSFAQIQRSVTGGVRGFSILDPASLKPRMRDQREGVTFGFKVKESEDDLLSLDCQLVFQQLKVTAGRKLPLRLGSKDFRIDNAVPKQYVLSCELSIPEDQTQLVFGTTDAESNSQMIVIVETSGKPAVVSKDDDLTLEHVLKIKDGLPSEPTLATKTEVAPVVPIVASDDPVEKSESTPETSESNPISLVLQCGKVDQEKSLNTKIGLTGKGSLTIEGEVESQQISADSVQVSGKNFVFRNEDPDFRRHEVDADGAANTHFDSKKARDAGLFNAKAATGSISFNRGGPIEDTMRLSLRSKVTLQFAGIEFSAESIECYPDRIEANGNVKVSIPEISSEVSAGRVIMNLESLSFDFDGDVKVERNIGEDSFPFLVKGNHVGWSLVTGEMQTEKRYSSPRQAVRQEVIRNRFGGSQFQRTPPVTGVFNTTPKVRQPFSQPSPSRSRFGVPPNRR